MDNLILTSFYPIAFIGRLFGYFPFCNLGRRVQHHSHLQTRRLSIFNALLIPFVLFLMTLSCSSYFRYWYVIVFNRLRPTIYNCFFGAYRTNSIVIFLQFICFKQKLIIKLLQQLSSIQNVNRCNLRSNSLIRLGYILAVATTILAIAYAIGIDSYYSHSSEWERVFSAIGSAGQIFSYNFVTALIVYFNSVLRWNFIGLGTELNKVCLSYGSSNFSECLSLIRRRHEQLIMLTEEFNDFLSPIFTVYMVAQSGSLCININDLVVTIIENQSTVSIVRAAVFMLIRFLPLMAVCLTSNALSQSANLNESNFNNRTFLNASTESEFQINMLHTQINRRKAIITADGFFIVDNRLLAQMTGSIVTYTVVMMEVDGQK